MSEVFIECWTCHTQVTLAERSDEDGCCPHCMCELDLEDYLVQSVAAIDTLRTANQRLEVEVKRLRQIAREFAGHFSSDDPKHWELHGLADGADYSSALSTTVNGEVAE